MAVIEYVTRSQAPQDVQKIYDAVEKQMGAVLGIMRALAYNQALLKSFLALNAASSQTKLEPRLRDLAYLMVSRLNGCDYCAHYHQITGRQVGLTEQQLQDVENFSSSGAYEPLQRNVLRYAPAGDAPHPSRWGTGTAAQRTSVRYRADGTNFHHWFSEPDKPL